MKSIKGAVKAVYYISFPLSFLGFILPIYASDLGSSPMEIGMLYSIFSLCSILIRPLVGRLVDSRGRKNGIIVGMFSYTLSIGLYLAAQDYSYILLARIVQSIGASFLWVSLDTMVSDVSSGEERAKNFGLMEQYSNRGAYLGSIIGFSILFNRNFGEPFKYIFGIYLIISIYALVKGVKTISETLNSNNIVKQCEAPIRNRQFLIYIAVMGILTAISSMTAPVFLVYLKETITKDLALISFLFVPGAFLSLFFPAKMGKLSDRIGRKVMLVSGMVLSALFTMIIPAAKGYYPIMGIYTLLAVSGFVSSPAQSALVTEITGGSQRGRAFGLYQLATGIGGTIGPLLGTIVYQYMGKEIIFYIQGTALMAAAFAVGLIIKERKTDILKTVKNEI